MCAIKHCVKFKKQREIVCYEELYLKVFIEESHKDSCSKSLAINI